MTIADGIPRFLSPRTCLLVGTSVATTLAVVAAVRLAFSTVPYRIIPSPRATQLPLLSKEEQEQLPYPPDVFPGGRDVTSCVGHVQYSYEDFG